MKKWLGGNARRDDAQGGSLGPAFGELLGEDGARQNLDDIVDFVHQTPGATTGQPQPTAQGDP